MVDIGTPKDTKLVLHHFGQDYYMDKIWIQGKNYGYEFPLPENVKARERERLAPLTVAATYQAEAPPQEVAQAAPPPGRRNRLPRRAAQEQPAPAPAPVEAAPEPAPAPAPAPRPHARHRQRLADDAALWRRALRPRYGAAPEVDVHVHGPRDMRIRKALSWVLILGGVVLLFLGVREVVDSWLGQREAERAWARSANALPAIPARAARPFVPDLGPAVARLSIPRLGSAWFVFAGVGKESLRLGPGHLAGTAMPGTAGNCVIAGHRDTHFRALKDVRKGDEILVTTRRGNFATG